MRETVVTIRQRLLRAWGILRGRKYAFRIAWIERAFAEDAEAWDL